jgi:hypothetical protein
VASSDTYDHERLAGLVDEQAAWRSVATLGVLAAKIFEIGCSNVRGSFICAQLGDAALVNRVSSRRPHGAAP